MGRILPVWPYYAVASLAVVGVTSMQPARPKAATDAPVAAASASGGQTAAPLPPVTFDLLTPVALHRLAETSANPIGVVILKNDGSDDQNVRPIPDWHHL